MATRKLSVDEFAKCVDQSNVVALIAGHYLVQIGAIDKKILPFINSVLEFAQNKGYVTDGQMFGKDGRDAYFKSGCRHGFKGIVRRHARDLMTNKADPTGNTFSTYLAAEKVDLEEIADKAKGSPEYSLKTVGAFDEEEKPPRLTAPIRKPRPGKPKKTPITAPTKPTGKRCESCHVALNVEYIRDFPKATKCPQCYKMEEVRMNERMRNALKNKGTLQDYPEVTQIETEPPPEPKVHSIEEIRNKFRKG